METNNNKSSIQVQDANLSIEQREGINLVINLIEEKRNRLFHLLYNDTAFEIALHVRMNKLAKLDNKRRILKQRLMTYTDLILEIQTLSWNLTQNT